MNKARSKKHQVGENEQHSSIYQYFLGSDCKFNNTQTFT